jgi:hypothetical protein
MSFKDLCKNHDVVYKLVKGEIFYEHLNKYLDGELWFSGWDKFDDKREGKYLCSSSVDKDLRKKLKEAKTHYTVCSTTLSPDIFELWDRFLENPPAICLVLRIEDLDTTGFNRNELNRNNPVQKDFAHFSGRLVDYRHKLKTSKELAGNDPDKKALEILAAKKVRFTYEQEYRLLWPEKTSAMRQTGNVLAIIIGGCCPQTDSAFTRVRNEAGKKGIPLFHALIDYTHESVEIRESVCSSCFSNQQQENNH